MKLPAYTRYKSSGVDWLGDVPEHWEAKRLKDSGTLIGGSGFPHEEQGVEDAELPFYKVGDLLASSDGRFMGAPPHTVSRVTAKKLHASLIPPASVVYAKIGAALMLNRRRVTTVTCCIDNNMTAYVPDPHWVSVEWAFHWLSTLDFREFMNPGAVPSFSEGYQASLPLLVPPPAEQQAIAEFLDRETGRMDRLVAKKRELIERLKEKRTALISRTVTRGLPPAAARAVGFPENPTLRPSALGAMPKIPAEWTVSKVWLERVARNIEYQDGNHGELHPKAEDYVDEGIPFVMANHIVAGQIDFTNCNYIEPELAASLRIGFARAGDVLLTHKGTIGRVGMVQENRFPYVMLTPQVTYYRCLRNIAPKYLFWFFQGKFWQDQMYLVSSLGTTRGYVGLLDQRFLNLLLPPHPEQAAIAAYLGFETAKVDALVEKVESAVERLLEYRTALIIASVSGKIDVRNAR